MILPFSGLGISFLDSGKNNGRYKGFLIGDTQWDDSFRKFKNLNPKGYRIKVDEESKVLFNNFLQTCKVDSISVILVYVPEYYEAQTLLLNRDSIKNLFCNYAKIYNIPFIDYSNSSICLDTTNFFNSQHLNKKGVFYFNKKLIEDIKQYIQF